MRTTAGVILAAAVLGAAGLAAWRLPPEHRAAPAPAEPPAPDPRVVAAHNRFGIRLLGRLADKPGASVFFSPYSISTALAMTWNGASGATKDAMARALALDSLPAATVNQANADLKAVLQRARPGARIAVANSLWAQRGVDFKAPFLAVNRTAYGAEVSELDFLQTPAGAVNAINDWTSQHTNGRIPKILSSVDPSTVLVLVNAIHFKGTWAEKFQKAATKPQPFTLHGGGKRSVPMMHRGGDIRFLSGDGFSAVSLPYADKRTSMVVFLPDAVDGLPAFLKSFTPERWEDWRTRFYPREGSVAIPRFRLEWGQDLTGPLSDMGMGVAFTDGADFSAMADRPVAISEVQHKAFVDVDEEGTEAAAATAVGVRLTSTVSNPVRFVADHPFLCAIVDDPTGEILFLGAVYEPASA